MRITPLVVLPLLLVTAIACGSDADTPIASGGSSTTTTVEEPSTTVPAAETCSTAGIRITLADQDLPPKVAATRKAIFDAAVACDYRALAALTGPNFSYSFGAEKGDVSAYWHKQEDDGVPVMKYLVQILNLPNVERPADGGTTYTSWPSADQDVRTQADWDALKGVYTDEQVAAFQKADLYTGYRAAITESGDWMYFVAGD